MDIMCPCSSSEYGEAMWAVCLVDRWPKIACNTVQTHPPCVQCRRIPNSSTNYLLGHILVTPFSLFMSLYTLFQCSLTMEMFWILLWKLKQTEAKVRVCMHSLKLHCVCHIRFHIHFIQIFVSSIWCQNT